MKTTIQFKTWYRNRIAYVNEEKLCEAAWNAALASADEEPENDRKAIGIAILERALREEEVLQAASPGYWVYKESIENLIQELRG